MTEEEKAAEQQRLDNEISLENLGGEPVIPIIGEKKLVEGIDKTPEYQDVTKLDKSYQDLLVEKAGANYDTDGNLLDKDNKVLLTKEEIESSLNPQPEFFNRNGDLVDAKGTVLKSKADLDAERLAAADGAEGDGDELPELFNTRGDLIKADGTVIRTKEDIDANINEDDGAVTVILKKYGINPIDETGQPIVFEDTLESFEKAADLVIKAKLDAQKEDFFANQPSDVKDYYLHRASGNAPDTFFKQVEFDVDNLVLDKNNKEQLKEVIKRGAIERGYSPEIADKQVQKSEAVDALFEDATIESDYMRAQKVSRTQANAATVAAQIEADKKAQIKVINEVSSIIKTKNIAGLKVLDNDVAPFTDFMLKDTGNGSPYQQKLNALTREQELMLAYWIFKDYNPAALVSEKAAQKTVLKFRQANIASKGGQSTQKMNKTEIATEDITLDAVI